MPIIATVTFCKGCLKVLKLKFLLKYNFLFILSIFVIQNRESLSQERNLDFICKKKKLLGWRSWRIERRSVDVNFSVERHNSNQRKLRSDNVHHETCRSLLSIPHYILKSTAAKSVTPVLSKLLRVPMLWKQQSIYYPVLCFR